MEIVKRNFASIANNEIEGARVSLSIALDAAGYFVCAADCDERDTPRFATEKDCANYIEHTWASPVCDLQF